MLDADQPSPVLQSLSDMHRTGSRTIFDHHLGLIESGIQHRKIISLHQWRDPATKINITGVPAIVTPRPPLKRHPFLRA